MLCCCAPGWAVGGGEIPSGGEIRMFYLRETDIVTEFTSILLCCLFASLKSEVTELSHRILGSNRYSSVFFC